MLDIVTWCSSPTAPVWLTEIFQKSPHKVSIFSREANPGMEKLELEHGEEADGEEAGVRKRGASELGAEAGGERLARAWSDSLGDSCGRASTAR